MSKPLFIGVAGNIGAGKTTLTEKLSDAIQFQPVYESVVDNPYLQDFYGNMNRWSFNLQVYFLYHRFQSQVDLLKSNKNFIQDRTIYEDKEIFARNLFNIDSMDKRDWETYKQLYLSMLGFIKKPDLIIYLKTSTDVLMSRIKKRKRNFEKEISPEYIYRLNVYYDQWIDSLSRDEVLIFNTDNFNIFKDHIIFEELVELIEKRLKLVK